MQIIKRIWSKIMSTSLNPHDEFLLILTRLWLELLNEDVADCFDILPAKSSFIFTTWIKLLNKLLKNLFAWLLGEAIPEHSNYEPSTYHFVSFFISIIYFKSLSPFTTFSRSLSFLHFLLLNFFYMFFSALFCIGFQIDEFLNIINYIWKAIQTWYGAFRITK